MTAAEIIRAATDAGLTLSVKGDQLGVVPADRLTPELRAALIAHKGEVLPYLRRLAQSPEQTLERFATSQGIDWPVAHSLMIPGDAEAGAAQFAAVVGDGIAHAGVACWLRLLAERATPAYGAWPTGYREGGTGLDAYGRPLPPARAAVTCGSCEHFQSDEINPTAGAGVCGAGVGHLSIGKSLHPMAPRNCDHHRRQSATGTDPE